MKSLVCSKENLSMTVMSWCTLAIFSRLIPHPPNATAMTCIALLACWHLTRFQSAMAILVSLFLSDYLLAYLHHYPFFGSWSLFTYSAYLLAIYYIPQKQPSNFQTLYYLVLFSFFFWLWTNFGVWLCGSYYPHNFNGLILCYYIALPFLKNSLLGNLMWMMGILSLQLITIKQLCKNSIATFYPAAC